MINILDKSKCCGCHGCSQICPKHCILMELDQEGFLYPRVESNRCIGCGMCEKVCPVQNIESNNDNLLRSFVAIAKKDEIREKSSSGGIFTLLAQKVLEDKGIVFGVAFDEQFTVHHIGIDKLSDIGLLQGSKYLQSRVENTYKEVKSYLNKGRKVLYSGTPCQIAGLKKYLVKSYKNLWTVEVLCHGAPSPKVWKKYLQEQEERQGAVVKQVNFRHKKSGWKMYSLELQFSDLTTYEQIFPKDYFMQMFLGDICLRPSCHECKFKQLDRCSDITLGDAWGIRKYMPDMDDDKGTSIILVHSEQGQKLLDGVRNQMVLKEGEVQRLLPPTSDSRKSVKPHKKRNDFFEKLDNDESCFVLAKLSRPPILRRVIGRTKRMLGKIKRMITQSK